MAPVNHSATSISEARHHISSQAAQLTNSHPMCQARRTEIWSTSVCQRAQIQACAPYGLHAWSHLGWCIVNMLYISCINISAHHAVIYKCLHILEEVFSPWSTTQVFYNHPGKKICINRGHFRLCSVKPRMRLILDFTRTYRDVHFNTNTDCPRLQWH